MTTLEALLIAFQEYIEGRYPHRALTIAVLKEFAGQEGILLQKTGKRNDWKGIRLDPQTIKNGFTTDFRERLTPVSNIVPEDMKFSFFIKKVLAGKIDTDDVCPRLMKIVTDYCPGMKPPSASDVSKDVNVDEDGAKKGKREHTKDLITKLPHVKESFKALNRMSNDPGTDSEEKKAACSLY